MYFLENKSDTVEATKKFLADSAPFGTVKRLRSDNGGEFVSGRFKALLSDNKIKHDTSAPYSPHQNGTYNLHTAPRRHLIKITTFLKKINSYLVKYKFARRFEGLRLDQVS